VSEAGRHLLAGVGVLAAGLAVAGLVPALEWLGLAGGGVGLASVCLGLVEVWDRWRASGDPR